MDMENLIGETTEYDKKAALEVRKPKSWCKSVSAFANTLGGALIFGMADDGQIVGLTEPDSDAEKISEILKTRMEPIPEFRLRFHRTEDGKVLLILDVFKGEETPYYYSGDGTLEAFVRIGNESVRASATELKRLVLRGRNTSYDSQMTLYRVEDYAFSKLRERYKKWTGNSFDNKDLVSFGLADEGGFLTNAGALIADESPIRWSRLFCTRWNGLDKSGGTMDALDDAEYSGSVLSLIENGEAFIKRNARMMWRKTPNSREELPEYVERSYHEALVNALAHRDYLVYGSEVHIDIYDDRLEMGELLALKWEDIDFSTAQLHVRRTINRLAKYEAHDGENKTEIVFGTPKTKNSRRTIPLTRTMADELARWKQQQAQDKIRAGDKYTDDGFIVTNEFGHYFEQKTFKDYYDRLLKDADIGHFTFHALRHTFATRALERGMDYKTLSAILGHYSVAFTMDTYVHSMDEHKRREMDKMDDMFGMQYSISVENQPYPVLCTLSADGCTAHVPDFPKIVITASTLDAALLEVKQQIQKALRQYKNPPIPTKQEQIVVPQNSVLVLVKVS